VFWRNVREHRTETVRVQRCDTTTVFPVTKRAFALSRRKNHLLVIAFYHDHITLLLQFNQSFKHRTAVTSLINQIAQKNQAVR